VDRAGQPSARKSIDVEVFCRDQRVVFHQPTAEIMMKGGTLVSEFTVRLGHQGRGLAAATAAALATGKPALGATQALLRFTGLYFLVLPYATKYRSDAPTERAADLMCIWRRSR